MTFYAMMKNLTMTIPLGEQHVNRYLKLGPPCSLHSEQLGIEAQYARAPL